jgi:hypothetical protein
MKLKILFVPETRFDPPIRCLPRTEEHWSRGIRDLWRTLTVAGRPKPINPELTGGIFPEDSSP